MHDKWILLFQETKLTIVMTNSPPHIICDDRIIIDDIILFSNHVSIILHHFSCVARVFTKYRFSFKLRKCGFFQPRVEYVGHDLTAHGNYPATSHFNLPQRCSLLPHGILFLSFISLCCFYSHYFPWFETNIKPLRTLQRLYHRNDIPIIG